MPFLCRLSHLEDIPSLLGRFSEKDYLATLRILYLRKETGEYYVPVRVGQDSDIPESIKGRLGDPIYFKSWEGFERVDAKYKYGFKPRNLMCRVKADLSEDMKKHLEQQLGPSKALYRRRSSSAASKQYYVCIDQLHDVPDDILDVLYEPKPTADMDNYAVVRTQITGLTDSRLAADMAPSFGAASSVETKMPSDAFGAASKSSMAAATSP